MNRNLYYIKNFRNLLYSTALSESGHRKLNSQTLRRRTEKDAGAFCLL